MDLQHFRPSLTGFRLSLVFLSLPVMPLFLPVSLVTIWMKSWEERCTHIREAGATKTFHFQINLALSQSSIWVVLMCLKSGGSALNSAKIKPEPAILNYLMKSR
jgi:hypothetical protein